MKLYIAGRYSRKDELAGEAAKFETAGHTITSTWFTEPHDGSAKLADLSAEQLAEYAQRDLDELGAADGIIFYSESDEAFNRRGGRHVEFGFALALGLVMVVVGPKENIFHYLADVQHVTTTEAAVRLLPL